MTQYPHIVVRWVSCFYSPVSVELNRAAYAGEVEIDNRRGLYR